MLVRRDEWLEVAGRGRRRRPRSSRESTHLGTAGPWPRPSECPGDVAFRTDYAGRQAVVRVDALAALALGLTLDEPLNTYRIRIASSATTSRTPGTTPTAASSSP